jgi:hypothetical protein
MIKYIKWLLRPKWLWLKVPMEYKSGKQRIKCLKATRNEILKHTKIIK